MTPALLVNTLGCPDWTTDDLVTRIPGMGYAGLELRCAPDGHLRPDATPEQAKELATQLAGAGIPVKAMLGYTSFAHADEAAVRKNQDDLRHLLTLAEAMGAGFVRTFAGRLPAGADRAAMATRVAKALKPVAAEARQRGVTIGLETHDDWCAGALVASVVEQAAEPALGVVWDVFNAFAAGLEHWEQTWTRIKPHTRYLHLKDGLKKPDGSIQYVTLGTGDLPVRDIFARLKQDGWSAPVSFEWEKKWHPELADPADAFPTFARAFRALWAA